MCDHDSPDCGANLRAHAHANGDTLARAVSGANGGAYSYAHGGAFCQPDPGTDASANGGPLAGADARAADAGPDAGPNPASVPERYSRRVRNGR